MDCQSNIHRVFQGVFVSSLPPQNYLLQRSVIFTTESWERPRNSGMKKRKRHYACKKEAPMRNE
eukprot:4425915-Amphidinium_carterae.1